MNLGRKIGYHALLEERENYRKGEKKLEIEKTEATIKEIGNDLNMDTDKFINDISNQSGQLFVMMTIQFKVHDSSG